MRLNSIYGLIIISLILFSFLASCSEDQNPMQLYGNTLTQSYKKAKDLDSAVNVQQVKTSIQEFYAANGRYPVDLNELARFNSITLKSNKYDYDPETGELTEK